MTFKMGYNITWLFLLHQPQPQEPLTTSTPKASVSSTVQKVEEVKTPVRQTIEEEDILREYDPNVAVGT